VNLPFEARGDFARVDVTRGGLVESLHAVSVAVVDAEGRLVALAGDPHGATFYRSAAKPFQALPLVEDGVADALELTDEELALCCASHSGEPRHLEVARSILRKAGLGPAALACGPHLPFHEETAARLLADGGRPEPLHNNCSGKHAGMLALAAAHGWPTEGYQKAAHPVQRRMLAEVARWTGLDEAEIGTGVDGCGVTCFAVSLRAMAYSFARFARAARDGESAHRVVAAMTGSPEMVGGTGRLCTAVMQSAGDTLFVKTGAEGVYCAGILEQGLGVALKVGDGAKRAAEVALLHVLEQLDALRGDDLRALRAYRDPELRNTRGEVVGRLRGELPLHWAAAADPAVAHPVAGGAGFGDPG